MVPEWIAMEDRIKSDSIPQGSLLSPLHEALLTYLDDHRRSLELLARAARTDSAADKERGTRLLGDAWEAKLRIHRLLVSLHSFSGGRKPG